MLVLKEDNRSWISIHLSNNESKPNLLRPIEVILRSSPIPFSPTAFLIPIELEARSRNARQTEQKMESKGETSKKKENGEVAGEGRIVLAEIEIQEEGEGGWIARMVKGFGEILIFVKYE